MSDGSGLLQPAPTRALGQVLDFMRLLWALDHALQRRSKQMHARLGITWPQRLVIRIVGRLPGISAGELAEILHLHPSTLTGVLARLKRRGLITRRSDPRDRRRTLLRLSTMGRKFDVESKGTIEAAIRAACGALPRQKIRMTAEVLSQLTRSLQGGRRE